MSYDHLPQHFVTGDQNAQKTDVVSENQRHATDAFQKQFQETQYGFLNGMTTAMGGEALRPGDPKPEHKFTKSEIATHNEAVTFGLANDHSSVKQEGSAVAEHHRQVAFESIYANAIGRSENQAGFPGRNEKTNNLDFNAPHLNTQGNGRQLQWATAA